MMVISGKSAVLTIEYLVPSDQRSCCISSEADSEIKTIDMYTDMAMAPLDQDWSDLTGIDISTPPPQVYVKPEVTSPSPRTAARLRARKVVQPYPDSDSDSDESQQSAYAPSPSSKRSSSRKNKSPKSSPKVCRKRSSPPRKGEPRRQQNMVAQKKYRDKKVQGAHLVRCCYA